MEVSAESLAEGHPGEESHTWWDWKMEVSAESLAEGRQRMRRILASAFSPLATTRAK